jgi:hypothetical protein
LTSTLGKSQATFVRNQHLQHDFILHEPSLQHQRLVAPESLNGDARLGLMDPPATNLQPATCVIKRRPRSIDAINGSMKVWRQNSGTRFAPPWITTT